MISALGYSHDDFNPAEPGRLCRGRERWIESWPREPDVGLFRLVISGARFTDDSARDAYRGIEFSGLGLGEVLARLYEGRELIACAEEAHQRRVPEGAEGLEFIEQHIPGGPLRSWSARWSLRCRSAEEIDAAVAAGADVFLLADEVEGEGEHGQHGSVPPAADDLAAQRPGLPESVRQWLFLLTGYRRMSPPTRRFQPTAVAEALEHVKTLILVHQDKHGPCVAIYGEEPPEGTGILDELAEEAGILAVPFAIPPMLARWDRALWELRQEWDESERGEFPVPPAPEDRRSWGRRRARGGSEE